MRLSFQSALLALILGSTAFAGAQSAPFRVKPSDIDSTIKDPGKEIKETHNVTPAQRPKSSGTSRDLQSLERQTAKTSGTSQTKKTSGASFKPEKDTAAPKINIKGSGEGKSGSQTRVATNSYKGRLKQKGSRSNNY
jgi:hypothetical protein